MVGSRVHLLIQLDHSQVVIGLEGGEEEDEEEHHGNHSATASDHKISKNTFINGLSPTQSYSQQSRPLPPLHKKTVQDSNRLFLYLLSSSRHHITISEATIKGWVIVIDTHLRKGLAPDEEFQQIELALYSLHKSSKIIIVIPPPKKQLI